VHRREIISKYGVYDSFSKYKATDSIKNEINA
jgi:hypothetical protein